MMEWRLAKALVQNHLRWKQAAQSVEVEGFGCAESAARLQVLVLQVYQQELQTLAKPQRLEREEQDDTHQLHHRIQLCRMRKTREQAKQPLCPGKNPATQVRCADVARSLELAAWLAPEARCSAGG
mmetsp:Transcript_68399/g.164176  ORF Transcript_68399/g.164176 Transcript_68399/m.164176 type:complete len:126 (+) Transcript_68399:240-617(+)